jgi:hypothetical protein
MDAMDSMDSATLALFVALVVEALRGEAEREE